MKLSSSCSDHSKSATCIFSLGTFLLRRCHPLMSTVEWRFVSIYHVYVLNDFIFFRFPAGYGNFTFKIDFYKSSSFATPYTEQDYPLSVAVNQYLYVRYSVESSADLVIMAVTCRATKTGSLYSWPQYSIILNGYVWYSNILVWMVFLKKYAGFSQFNQRFTISYHLGFFLYIWYLYALKFCSSLCCECLILDAKYGGGRRY